MRLHFVGQFPANLLPVSPRRGAHPGEAAKALGLVDDEEEEDIVNVLKIKKYFEKYFKLIFKKERQIKMFVGHKHNFEMNLLKCAWSPDDSKITAGSADR